MAGPGLKCAAGKNALFPEGLTGSSPPRSAAGPWERITPHEDQTFDTDSGPLADQDEWSSMGAKIQNEFYLTDDHLVTMGMDTAALGRATSEHIVRTVSGFIQDRWHVTPRFSVTPGLRYETIRDFMEQ